MSTNFKRKEPLYLKVYDYLLEKIENEFAPDDLLPPQSKIAEDTQTSLITVKRAIKELEVQGYLQPKAGRGTIVKRPTIVDNHVGVSSWTDSISDQGIVPGTAWMKMEKKSPVQAIVNKLELKAREKTIQIKRLREIDGNPICLMSNEIPLRLVPEINKKNMDKESLYVFLKDEFNLVPASADEEVYARQATDYEVKTLQLKTPIVLVVERLSFMLNNTPFEFSSIIAPADSYIYKSKQFNKTIHPEELKKLIEQEN